MKSIVFVYDNIEKPIDRISNIIGDKSFAEIIVKRKSFLDKCKDAIKSIDAISSFTILNNTEDLNAFAENIESKWEGKSFFHFFSKYMVSSESEFEILLSKLSYSSCNVKEQKQNDTFLYFENRHDYIKFLNRYANGDKSIENIEFINLQKNVINFIDLNEYQSFLKYISGGFDTRSFNSITGDDLFITKKSSNKKKIEMEYQYYYLLPDRMKTWMVMPFDFKEEESVASYTMERLKMSDIAIRWSHGAVSMAEMDNILSKLFVYVKERPAEKISRVEFVKMADDLYLNKLDTRIEELKRHSLFHIVSSFIEKNTNYGNLDSIIEKYKKLYKSITFKNEDFVKVIGHGDLCFSNILYNDDLSMMKLIDPKGALTEEDLWTNPYYDIAKLSHSICGKYDFFNSGMYDIVLDNNLQFELRVFFDNAKYIEKFKSYVTMYGYDYRTIRILEASLFLSMLPLHMDYPRKVFGFLLNAINILEE